MKEKEYNTDNVLSIDLGQTHPMVCFNRANNETLIYNGDELNSKMRYRNKELAKLQKKIACCEKIRADIANLIVLKTEF